VATDTKQRMIEAAAAQLRTVGLAATSFTDVVAASGAARGAIYHHFPAGKAELVRDAVAWTGQRVAAEFASIEATDPNDVVAAFLIAVRPAVEMSAGGASCAVAAVTLEAAQLDPTLTATVQTALASWVDTLDRQLRRAGSSETAARTLSTLLIAFLEGSHVLCRAEGSTAPFENGAVGMRAAARAMFSLITATP